MPVWGSSCRQFFNCWIPDSLAPFHLVRSKNATQNQLPKILRAIALHSVQPNADCLLVELFFCITQCCQSRDIFYFSFQCTLLNRPTTRIPVTWRHWKKKRPFWRSEWTPANLESWWSLALMRTSTENSGCWKMCVFGLEIFFRRCKCANDNILLEPRKQRELLKSACRTGVLCQFSVTVAEMQRKAIKRWKTATECLLVFSVSARMQSENGGPEGSLSETFHTSTHKTESE